MLIDQMATLPIHLLERTRIYQQGENVEGQFVLYWMRTAVRAEENPALDTALALAERRSLPVLVYHAISEHYEYASDRHHTFMLEGARDVQRQLRDRGINYAFHLATRDDRKLHLVTLADQAALVVTEDMPVDPPRRFLKKLASQVKAPILCVDTACVVPMQLIKRSYDRAFQFRSATEQLCKERLTRAWPEWKWQVRCLDLKTLPFTPVDLQSADLSELVSRCEIDHSVGPVVDTPGGSSAGYARWNRFQQSGLGKYAQQRNNALLDGVSRMSAYLHYGMVSPLRIAREAAAIDNAGSEKYLDELLIWREMAYSFCFHRADHDAWSALPAWAQTTFEAHAADQRSQIYSWEQLARAQTHDTLWNAAQTSLLMQGELHNNVRMTWGKAILNWTKSPQHALKMLVDLNHRYALDGRDPASYGGLLWCLGQFDRPFEPESPILGSVRPRSTADHARRLDTQAYLAHVATPRCDPLPQVAVIGAGISGLFAARTLADHGLPVTVFDKGRGVGGRMSSRQVDGQWCFDHGAQYFTARDPQFLRYVDSWLQQGVVARWPNVTSDPSQKIVVLKQGEVIEKQDAGERFVGSPAMSSVCDHLASDLNIRTQTQIGKIESAKEGLCLMDQAGKLLGTYDRLIVSAPAAQTAELLANYPGLSLPISKIKMQPCWAVMATFEQTFVSDWAAAFVHDSILTWIARNSTKPNRPANAEHIVLHASHEWTSSNWDRNGEDIAEELLAAFWQASGISPHAPSQLQAHRWKFAIPIDPPVERCFFDKEFGIAACGDWASGARVEGAFLSGMAAAGRILGSLARHRHATETQLALF